MENKISEIIVSLHSKFAENITHSVSHDNPLLEEFEIKSRAIYHLGHFLSQDASLTDTQKSILHVYSEIFTDLSIVMYLACCAIDNPTKILLRRVLELGVSTIYLWDQPYKYWNWKGEDDHANDLSFKDMVEYLNNSGFIDYVNNENKSSISEFVNKTKVNKIYRELSNVIHGKSNNFESLKTNSFGYVEKDLLDILKIGLIIENILLSIWYKRFPEYCKKLEIEVAAITKYKYEY